MSLVFLMQGYGGCFSPPCRQRPNVPRWLISRALKVCKPVMELARPADGFGFYEVIQWLGAVRVSATDELLYYLISHDFCRRINALLRFLIISEVSLTGEQLNHALNLPVSLTATGFEGV